MNMTKKSIPIAAYARTNNVNTTGSYCGSIQEQINAIGYWAKYNNFKVVSEYKDECVSGNDKFPPELTQLANDLEEKKIKIKYVAVCELSRISRNLQVSMWFHNKLDISKIKLISLSESCGCSLYGPYIKRKEALSLKKRFWIFFKSYFGRIL